MTPDELPDDMEAPTPAPEGEAWRTVPVEPTEAMLVNGREALMPLVRLDSYGPLIGVWGDMLAASPVVPVGVSVDALAQEIRRVDGRHTLGAGALAEALLPFLAALRPTDTGRE
jgi:hypothetical protein